VTSAFGYELPPFLAINGLPTTKEGSLAPGSLFPSLIKKLHQNLTTMAEYRISGIWREEKVISHYAVHTKTQEGGYTRAVKTSKTNAIKMLEVKGSSAKTWMWDYLNSRWKDGADVEIVNGANGKFLRSDPDTKTTDNLEHLINCNWFLE